MSMYECDMLSLKYPPEDGILKHRSEKIPIVYE